MKEITSKQIKFMNLFRPVQRALEKYIFSISNNPEEAKEIISETIYIAYKSFDSLKYEKAFLSYLFTIAKRVSVNEFRSRSKTELISPEIADNFSNNLMSPEIQTDIFVLKEAMKEINEKNREALILFEVSGFSQKEIAEIQNCSLVSVKVRIHRARKQLAKILRVEDNKKETYNIEGVKSYE